MNNKRLKPPWQFEDPMCSEIGPNLFYMEDDGLPVSLNDVRKIKSLCGQCIHQFDCAEWGIQRERFGIWGGLNPKERSNIRRRRRVVLIDEEISVAYRQ